MTDLEINIELAKAMGWDEYDIATSFHKQTVEAYDFDRGYWRPFDYRDPVILVAICKHWLLEVNHAYRWVSGDAGFAINAGFGTIEKAAALCVIELAKRGVK